MRKTISMNQERDNKHANDDAVPKGAVPAYLLDREGVSHAKVLSNTVKQKRKEKAGKWDVPVSLFSFLFPWSTPFPFHPFFLPCSSTDSKSQTSG
jgi:hypothetical protein